MALLTVLASLVLTPRLPALAAEPTLQEAIAQQRALEQTLADQRARLDELSSSRVVLEQTLADAEARLGAVAAELSYVSLQLADIRSQIASIEEQLVALEAQIAEMDAQLSEVARQIAEQTHELAVRTALLEDHLRAAYERSQTSLLEILLSAESLDEVSTEVTYLFAISEGDRELADGIREVRAELEVRQQTLVDGRNQLAEARRVAEEHRVALDARRAELADLEAQLAQLQVEAQAARDQEAAALQQILLDEEETQRIYEQNVVAHAAQEALVAQLQAEADRLAREAEEARRRESSLGFRWPMESFIVTQEFGPTDFPLEPPECWKGTCYAHFHGGIDISAGCGTPILASGAGVVLASGRPNPASDGYGVVISHGGGIQTWYWHLTTQVVVSPGQQVSTGQVIGYEGNTGFSTGCHLHFSFYDNGEWENPRNYLP